MRNKKLYCILGGILCLQLAGCAANPIAEEQEIPDAYDAIIRQYETAVAEGWDTAKMTENNLDYMVAYCLEQDEQASVGYFEGDLNGDGQIELAIAAESDSEYFAGMIFALYELVDGENLVLVESGERDRWYYAGEGKLYNEAFGNAFESVYSLCTADWNLSYLDAVGRNAVEYPDDPWLRFTGQTWEHISEEEANAVRSDMKNNVTNLEIVSFQ